VTVPRTADVLVVGAGVIGCAVARELAGGGRRVVVVDRGAVGGEASSAAAGVLAVASAGDEDARLRLRRTSAAAFPELVAALRDETGIEPGWVRAGVTALAFDDADLAALAARVAAARRADGCAATLLAAGEVVAAEPAASPAAVGGAAFPDDATVVAARFVAALAESARRRGAMLVPGAPVHDAERRGERIARVRVGETWVEAGTVVLAAGAWSSAIGPFAGEVDVAPVRGQMLALRTARAPRGVLTAGDAFLVPRPDGELWVGATFEPGGFEKAVTPGGLRALVAHVERLAPAAARDGALVRAWAGLRPSRDGGPVIGRSPRTANLVVATGHHRAGILLAPVTAAAVCACVDGAAPPAEVAPFAPR
jgi:glycine oxidase